jgi:hypothetical protein
LQKAFAVAELEDRAVDPFAPSASLGEAGRLAVQSFSTQEQAASGVALGEGESKRPVQVRIFR